METLPAELKIEICSHLSRTDLLTLTRTCSSLAAAAKPSLFETLTFHGDSQTNHQHMLLRHPRDRVQNGCFNLPCFPVGLTSLEKAIDKAVRLGITRYAKTFQYSPKIFAKNFWVMFREWIDEQVNDIGGDFDAWDEDDTCNEDNERDSDYNLDQEVFFVEQAKLFDNAESYWNAKVLEQAQRASANHAALVRLFRSMPLLSSVQILEWGSESELRKHGIRRGGLDEDVGRQFAHADILNTHLETLGAALQEAGVDVQHLLLPTTSGQVISSTSGVQHLFSGLKHLAFDLEHPHEMLAHYNSHVPGILTLIRCARNTLTRLNLNNHIFYSHHLPQRGEHLLEKLWGDDPDCINGTLVFPRLRHLEITILILYAPSLINFLQAQPELQETMFDNVYIHTPGYGWSDVAAALPPSCQILRIHSCGGQATSRVMQASAPHPDVAYSQIPPFEPSPPSWPTSSGWRTSDSFIKEEAEIQAGRELSVVKGRLTNDIVAAQQGSTSTCGRSLCELRRLREIFEQRVARLVTLIQDGTFGLNCAEYERIAQAA